MSVQPSTTHLQSYTIYKTSHCHIIQCLIHSNTQCTKPAIVIYSVPPTSHHHTVSVQPIHSHTQSTKSSIAIYTVYYQLCHYHTVSVQPVPHSHTQSIQNQPLLYTVYSVPPTSHYHTVSVQLIHSHTQAAKPDIVQCTTNHTLPSSVSTTHLQCTKPAIAIHSVQNQPATIHGVQNQPLP